MTCDGPCACPLVPEQLQNFSLEWRMCRIECMLAEVHCAVIQRAKCDAETEYRTFTLASASNDDARSPTLATRASKRRKRAQRVRLRMWAAVHPDMSSVDYGGSADKIDHVGQEPETSAIPSMPDLKSLPASSWGVIHNRFSRPLDLSRVESGIVETKYAVEEAVNIFISFVESVSLAVQETHDIDISGFTNALCSNFQELRGTCTTESLSLLEVRKCIDDLRTHTGSFLRSEFGVECPDVPCDFDEACSTFASNNHCPSKPVDKARRPRGFLLSPPWMGLKAPRNQTAVAVKRAATVNRHGGASSSVSQGRHDRRSKDRSLPKSSDGKYKVT
eukprot:TRINITY_DN14371_c1_g3_i3.p1 TRINITY_DN14371_c1_g3~~TRINITY_DN14371_c1_g3_i3.p1  ORF type:complete len:333 (-),score=34.68 TRINITY_DN14371_c1_g3_i3:202-1200(-)